MEDKFESVTRHSIYVDIVTRFDNEYETLCKNYDIDQDNNVYDKLEGIAESMVDAIYTQEINKSSKQY
tara:strand:+ start:279 stop:482 length:204 start_codon:yes stop_codon:yes gene_type:complete